MLTYCAPGSRNHSLEHGTFKAKVCTGAVARILIFSFTLTTCGCAPFSSNAKYLFSPDVNMSNLKGPQQSGALSVGEATEIALRLESEYRGAKAEYGSVAALTGISESGRERVYMMGANALECLVSSYQAYDVNLTNFDELQQTGSMLDKKRDDMSVQTAAFEQMLSQELTKHYDCSADAVWCASEHALLLVKRVVDAAQKTLVAAREYRQYSFATAGKTMLLSTYAINNEVSSALIDSEPDTSRLAMSLGAARPPFGAPTLAAVQTMRTALERAEALKQLTQERRAVTAEAAISRGGAKSAAPADELGLVERHLEDLLAEGGKLLDLTVTMAAFVPTSDPQVESKTCTGLASTVSSSAHPLALSPSGDVPLYCGGEEEVGVSGGNAPYSVRLLNDHAGVTATEIVQGNRVKVVLGASSDARLDSRSVLMVNDSSGYERSANVVISNDPALPHCPRCGKPRAEKD